MDGGAKRLCSWGEVTDWIASFSFPNLSMGEGEVTEKVWVFRGLKDSSYPLKPSIEREAKDKTMEWAALETLVASEFKARARSHLMPSSIPEDELTWLAQMQHYAVPSRLLDFTYSPYVALYFSIRNNENRNTGYVRVYAINASLLNDRFGRVASTAKRMQVADAASSDSPALRVASLRLDSYATDRDNLVSETQGLRGLVIESLEAEGKRRYSLNQSGCVCGVAPPSFNPRLASQQGLFLVNCAEQLTFEDSLNKMMGELQGWQCSADIPLGLAPEIEKRLFQMNIHDQSLFPDLEGLAGFIRQKIRLHWG